MAVPRAARSYRAWLLAGSTAAAAVTYAAPVALADKKDETRGPLFDPEALERGAAALREINKSPHAKQVLCWRRTRACYWHRLPSVSGLPVHVWKRPRCVWWRCIQDCWRGF
jgi:hypothetical protein